MKGIILRLATALVMCIGCATLIGSASAGGNHCTDRCADRYHYQKEACKLIPDKYSRKRCEHEAQHAKDQCKHHCG